MDRKEVEDIVDKKFNEQQYNVPKVPYHTHNGTDSPQIVSTDTIGGVTQLVGGTNVTISPVGGTGVVTVNSTASGAVTSVTAGTGISVSPHTGAVVVTNTGVTQLVAGSNISLSGTTGVITVTATTTGGSVFGGNGVDGALLITSGTTSINLGGAKVVVKNYSSIEISGTGALTFTNPHAAGTIIVMKSQSSVVLTSSTNPLIDIRSLGSPGTAGTAASGGSAGGGGTGGPSMANNGNSSGTSFGGGGLQPSATVAFGYWYWFTQTGSTAPSTLGNGIAGVAPTNLEALTGSFPSPMQYLKAFVLPGVGGTGAQGGANNGTAGGAGAGALSIECAGAFNFTGTINAAGNNGTTAGTAVASTGGGGGGGAVQILYNILTANSGTITVTGGLAGALLSTGNVGGNGGTGVAYINQNSEF